MRKQGHNASLWAFVAFTAVLNYVHLWSGHFWCVLAASLSICFSAQHVIVSWPFLRHQNKQIHEQRSEGEIFCNRLGISVLMFQTQEWNAFEVTVTLTLNNRNPIRKPPSQNSPVLLCCHVHKPHNTFWSKITYKKKTLDTNVKQTHNYRFLKKGTKTCKIQNERCV